VLFRQSQPSAALVGNKGLLALLDDNNTLVVDESPVLEPRYWARRGAVSGVDTDTRGTYFFDAFESPRSTFIGP
jgi:hypothetical protein